MRAQLSVQNKLPIHLRAARVALFEGAKLRIYGGAVHFGACGATLEQVARSRGMKWPIEPVCIRGPNVGATQQLMPGTPMQRDSPLRKRGDGPSLSKPLRQASRRRVLNGDSGRLQAPSQQIGHSLGVGSLQHIVVASL